MSDSSEIRKRRTADDEEELVAVEDQGINVSELTAALRKSNVRQASYLGARLASFDKNNDGNISIGELGAIVEELVFKENQNGYLYSEWSSYFVEDSSETFYNC
jgi:Ca2+-binding EF-hand superfamily protein